jgi:hypothetical protein
MTLPKRFVRNPKRTPRGSILGLVNDNAETPGTWGTCRFCGVAVPYGASRCPECNAEGPLSPKELRTAPKRLRWRVRFTGILRTVIVVGVIGGLAYATLAAVLQGPPVLSSDPLTTAAGYSVGPGNYTLISGEITGGDYVVGNYSSFHPVGMDVNFVIYNSSEWSSFVSGGSPTPAYSGTSSYSGRIVYSAPVTDNYYFVFTNPYPVATHLTFDIYVATEYESNVGDDGLA